jgi:hypothetical protein
LVTDQVNLREVPVVAEAVEKVGARGKGEAVDRNFM